MTARPLNGSAILLQWEPPLEPYGVHLVSYTAIVHQTGTTQYVNFDLPGNATEYVVGKLQPSTLYTVGVYAASRTGAGPAVFVSPVMTMRLSESTRCPPVTTSSHACNLGLQHCPLDLTVLEHLDPPTAPHPPTYVVTYVWRQLCSNGPGVQGSVTFIGRVWPESISVATLLLQKP